MLRETCGKLHEQYISYANLFCVFELETQLCYCKNKWRKENPVIASFASRRCISGGIDPFDIIIKIIFTWPDKKIISSFPSSKLHQSPCFFLVQSYQISRILSFIHKQSSRLVVYNFSDILYLASWNMKNPSDNLV